MKTVVHGASAKDHLLHIEADGCVINIRVGLTDEFGRRVTSISVSPDDETRSPGPDGRYWHRDGDRIIQSSLWESRADVRAGRRIFAMVQRRLNEALLRREEFDVTELVTSMMSREEAEAIRDGDESSDRLFRWAVGEGRIAAWDGPFTVYVQDRIADYFEEEPKMKLCNICRVNKVPAGVHACETCE